MQTLLDSLTSAKKVTVTLARDHAPHINVMAHHGVLPYARNKFKPKAAA